MDLKNTKRSEMYKNRKEDLLVQSIKTNKTTGIRDMDKIRQVNDS